MKDATQFLLKQLITFIRGQNYWRMIIWDACRGQCSVGVAAAVAVYLSFDRFIPFLILNVHLANKKDIKSKVKRHIQNSFTRNFDKFEIKKK